MSNNSIWSINRTQSGATTPGEGGPWSNDNEDVLQIPTNPKTGTSPSNCVTFKTVVGWLVGWLVFPVGRDAVGVFHGSS